MQKQYDNIDAIRRSDLWEARKSPMHYLYRVMNPPETTPALQFGIAAHKYILEPDTFWDDYIFVPKIDRRTKAGKEEYQKILDSGKIPISPDDFEIITNMDAMIKANETASMLLKTGEHEVPVEWTDPETGEKCKCRPDVITNIGGVTWIVDYKTTTTCEGSAFERSCRAYGYKLQAAMYTEGVFNATLENCRFAFVAQEKTPPYAVRVYRCDPGFIEEGMEQYRDLITMVHKCKESGEWPGYEEKELVGDE